MGKKSVSELAIENMRDQVDVLLLAIRHLEEQQRQQKKKPAARKPVAVEKAG